MMKRPIKAAKTGSSKTSAAPLRPSSELVSSRDVGSLIDRVVAILDAARSRVARTVNSTMVLAYWHVGREIVEFVQHGAKRAEYGDQVLEELSSHLRARVGRGYSTTNLRYFRTFYLAFRNRAPEIRHIESGESQRQAQGTPLDIRHNRSGVSGAAPSMPSLDGFSPLLGWSHYRALMNVEHEAARAFYEIEAERSAWPVVHLERQIHTQLFARLLKSRNKTGVMDLAQRGQTIERPIDLMKSPVVLDFLDLPDSDLLRENDLERAIISKLSQFLLELGKGFAFVARQKRLTFEQDEFYVDLVFYNIILKCYLLIDLKLGRLTHQDVGQMDSYVRLFDAQGRTDGDGPTIGLILCAEKNEAIARYSILSEHKQLFAAKYVTFLPSVEELERELERERRVAESAFETPSAVKLSTRAKRPANSGRR